MSPKTTAKTEANPKPEARIPSVALMKAINEIIGSFGRTSDKIKLAFETGRKEGFTDMETGNFIRPEIEKAGFNVTRVVSLYFPETAKHRPHVSTGMGQPSGTIARARARAATLSRKRIMISQMKVEDYLSGALENYPKHFLIAIIKWYEAKEAELQRRQAEIAQLLTPVNKKPEMITA